MPTWRSRCIAVVLAGAGGVAGCSLAFHPSDYFGPPGAEDGGLDALTLPDVPSSTDAPPTDASPAPDVLADTTSDVGDAGASPFCTGVDAAFCADFDENSLTLGWTLPVHSVGSGTLTLDTSIAQSKPGCARATMPMLDTPDAAVDDEEFLQKTLLTPWREATLDFDMYLAPASGHGVAIVSFVFVGDESVGASIAFAVQANELQLAGMQTTDATSWMYGAAPYVPSTWSHIQLDVLPATSGGKIAISVGGSPVESWTGLSFTSDPSAELLELELGMSRYGNDTNAVDVRYDNVVIRLL
jgi:hypothetical protein